jgi:SAM-dependent methyltransferase
MNARARWEEALQSLSIPPAILAAAPESPRGCDPDLFRRRAEFALRRDLSPSNRRALEALPVGGSVLDVGVGAGAASLPLAPRACLILGVDPAPDMLSRFEACAALVGVRTEAVLGTWPEIASQIQPTDVVVCHHVLYQAGDLVPFVEALSAHARRRVVIEVTASHPLAWMTDLWRRFHGVGRAPGPTADDATDVIQEMGIPVRREDHVLTPLPTGFERREDAVAEVRRRLCLPPERDPEVEQALGSRLVRSEGLWTSFPQRQRIVTLWWDVTEAG